MPVKIALIVDKIVVGITGIVLKTDTVAEINIDDNTVKYKTFQLISFCV